jgi:TPR repeat protein
VTTQYPESLVELLKKSLAEADAVLQMFRTASRNNFFESLVRAVTIDSAADVLGLGKLTRKSLAFATQIEFYLEFKWDHESFFRNFLTSNERALAEWNANQNFFNWYTEGKEQAVSHSILGLYLDYSDPTRWNDELVSLYSQSTVQKAIRDSPLLGCPLVKEYARRRIEGWKRHLPHRTFDRDFRGLNWLRAAAATGNAVASRELAHRYDSGDGVLKDHALASKFYTTASDKGDSEGQHMLGYYYASGIGVDKNPAEAVRLYRLAAAQGNAHSKFNLASHLRQGEGVQKNLNEAFQLLNSESDSYNSKILGELGIYYSNGWGTRADRDMAIFLFGKAAKFDCVARYNLGLEYLDRDSSCDDKIEAFKWIQLAISGSRNGELSKFAYETHKDLKEGLTPNQLTEAQSRIEIQLREWK